MDLVRSELRDSIYSSVVFDGTAFEDIGECVCGGG